MLVEIESRLIYYCMVCFTILFTPIIYFCFRLVSELFSYAVRREQISQYEQIFENNKHIFTNIINSIFSLITTAEQHYYQNKKLTALSSITRSILNKFITPSNSFSDQKNSYCCTNPCPTVSQCPMLNRRHSARSYPETQQCPMMNREHSTRLYPETQRCPMMSAGSIPISHRCPTMNKLCATTTDEQYFSMMNEQYLAEKYSPINKTYTTTLDPMTPPMAQKCSPMAQKCSPMAQKCPPTNYNYSETLPCSMCPIRKTTCSKSRLNENPLNTYINSDGCRVHSPAPTTTTYHYSDASNGNSFYNCPIETEPNCTFKEDFVSEKKIYNDDYFRGTETTLQSILAGYMNDYIFSKISNNEQEKCFKQSHEDNSKKTMPQSEQQSQNDDSKNPTSQENQFYNNMSKHIASLIPNFVCNGSGTSLLSFFLNTFICPTIKQKFTGLLLDNLVGNDELYKSVLGLAESYDDPNVQSIFNFRTMQTSDVAYAVCDLIKEINIYDVNILNGKYFNAPNQKIADMLRLLCLLCAGPETFNRIYDKEFTENSKSHTDDTKDNAEHYVRDSMYNTDLSENLINNITDEPDHY